MSNTTTVSEVFLKACKVQDIEKIRACLTLGVDINYRGPDNHSALYYSLFNSDQKVFDLLIDHPDLDVDQINKEKILKDAVYIPGSEDQWLRKLCNLPGIDVNAGNPLVEATLCPRVVILFPGP